jgi:hypothetical protein
MKEVSVKIIYNDNSKKENTYYINYCMRGLYVKATYGIETIVDYCKYRFTSYSDLKRYIIAHIDNIETDVKKIIIKKVEW